MNIATVNYCGWVITSYAKAILGEDDQIIYEASAIIERFCDPSEDEELAQRQEDLRRIYGARGAFGSERAARDVAISTAKQAIDRSKHRS